MRKTGRATGVPNRLCRREEIPHPPRDFLSPPPHRRKKGQILEPDRSRANRTGHLDVLTIHSDVYNGRKVLVLAYWFWVNLHPKSGSLGCRSCHFWRKM